MKRKTALLTCIMASAMIMATGCSSTGDDSYNHDGTTDITTAHTADENSSLFEQVESPSEDSAPSDAAESSVPSGTYAVTCTEEFDEDVITYEVSYTFCEDHTGIFSCQDFVEFTWDEDSINFETEERSYTLDGSTLIVEEDGNKSEFPKRVSDDPLLNGDFSSLAGSYKATDMSNNNYGGGEPLNDLVLGSDGSITGGNATYTDSFFPTGAPKLVTKTNIGTYECVITPDAIYTIYPEGVAQLIYMEDEAYSYLVDSVYINCFVYDGGVMDSVYYQE